MTPRDRYLRRTYDITEQQYEDLLAFQGGVCAICGRPPGKVRLAVDHDHKTNEVRGLLCGTQPNRNCNRGLPWFRDDPVLFRRAADYLANPPWRRMNDNAIPAD